MYSHREHGPNAVIQSLRPFLEDSVCSAQSKLDSRGKKVGQLKESILMIMFTERDSFKCKLRWMRFIMSNVREKMMLGRY